MDEQYNLPTKNKKKRILPAIIVAIVITAAIIITIVYNLPSNRCDRQLALAEKYMSELNYEAAILAYKAAIEIDPKCEDAYIELVNLYIAMEAYDEAENVIAKAEQNIKTDVVLTLNNSLYDNTLSDVSENKNQLFENDTIQSDNESTEIVEESSAMITRHLILKKSTTYMANSDYIHICEENYDYNGNVIKIADRYGYDSGEYIEEYLYDENNNLTDYVSYDENGIISSKKHYDNDGNVLEYTDYDSNGNIINQRVHEITQDGSIHIYDLTLNTSSNELFKEYEEFYDSSGVILSSISYRTDGTLRKTVSYQYENSNLIAESSTDDNGQYNYLIEYDYDTDNRLISKKYSDTFGYSLSKVYSVKYTYDNNGNRIESTYDSSDNLKSISIYDNNNNLLKSESYSHDKLLSEHIYEYDDYGNIILDKTSFTVYTYNYEYDHVGNIIAMQEYINEGDTTSIYQEYKHEYDTNGKEVKYSFNDNSIPSNIFYSGYILYEYNSIGDLIRETLYSSNDAVQEWTEYEYIYD